MGAKRSWQRKHVHISIACLILFLIASCASWRQILPASSPCAPLESVRKLVERGDFEAAMKESQEVLAGSPKTPPGDEALMNMGLLCAHYANPKKDYKKAMGYFMRIERDFPRSPFVEEAKIWTSVLQAFEKAKQVDLEIEQKKKEMGK
ncbi:MAG TPA: tetratricopeptide repeat protein [Nitrospirota bacterium]